MNSTVCKFCSVPAEKRERGIKDDRMEKPFKGKTIYAQSALARRVRQNFLGNGRLMSSAPFPPPPTPSGFTHRPPQ